MVDVCGGAYYYMYMCFWYVLFVLQLIMINQLFIGCVDFLSWLRAGLVLFSLLFLLVSCVGTDGGDVVADRILLGGGQGAEGGGQKAGYANLSNKYSSVSEDAVLDLSEFSSDYVLYVSVEQGSGDRSQVLGVGGGGHIAGDGYLSRGFSSLAGAAGGGVEGIKGAGVGLGQAFVTDLAPRRGICWRILPQAWIWVWEVAKKIFYRIIVLFQHFMVRLVV